MGSDSTTGPSVNAASAGESPAAGVALSPELLALLACPQCHSRLAVDHDSSALVCLSAECGLAYPVVDHVPVLLVDEAQPTVQRTP